MSENEQGRRLPAGWRGAVWPHNEYWLWMVWRDANAGCSREGSARSEALGWGAAREAAAALNADAPPAWMVEVAREIGARICERQNYPQGAKAYRDGDHDNSNGVQGSVSALRLALERGHVVEPREWTEEELLAAAREDAAQVNDVRLPGWSKAVRAGEQDDHGEVQSALQARRNMLREGGAVAAPAAPRAEVEDALKRAWECGADFVCGVTRRLLATAEPNVGAGLSRDRDVAAIISTLPTREA